MSTGVPPASTAEGHSEFLPIEGKDFRLPVILSAHHPVLMDKHEKPLPPGDNECCESGCKPCVWDIYRENLRAWEEAQKQIAISEEQTSDPSA